MHFVEVNGTALRYDVCGSGSTLVLIHEMGGTLESWDLVVPLFSAKRRVLRYDTRGHGGSDAPAGPYTLDELAEDARALLGALGISTTHWVGLSMGGMIGQTLALKAPELFASLVLCDTTSRVPPEAKPQWEERIRTADTQGMESLVEPTLGRWFTPPFRERQPEVVERVGAMIRGRKPAGYIGCCRAIAGLDLTDRVGAIKLPTLVIVGEEDPGTPVAAARVLHERIKGSELVVLKSASHLSNLEQPDLFSSALTDFLRRVR